MDDDIQGASDGELVQIVDEAEQVSHQDVSDHVQNNLGELEVPEDIDASDMPSLTLESDDEDDHVSGKQDNIEDETKDEDSEDDGDDNLAQLAKTGQIPDALLKDIMAEAGHYMTLYNYNPSSFLKK